MNLLLRSLVRHSVKATVCLSFVLPSIVQAQVNGSWNTNNGGSWGTSSNWFGSPATIPGGAGSVIDFTRTGTGTKVISLDAERIVGILNFSFAGSSTLEAGTAGSLTFDNAASAAQLNYGRDRALTINAPVTLNSSLNISSAGDTGTANRLWSGNITAGGTDTAKVLAYTAAKEGAGRLVLTGIISDGAGNRKVSVHMNAAGGIMELRNANTFSGGVQVSAGLLGLQGGTTINESVLGSGTLKLDGGSLRIAYLSSLNLANNTVIAANTTISTARSNAGSAVTFTLGTLSIGNYSATVDNTGSLSTGNTDTLAFGATTLTGNATFVVKKEAAVQTQLSLGTLNGAFNFTKTGNGILNLTAAAGTYSGTTQINEGTVIVGNSTALGSGTAILGGASAATLSISNGITVANTILFANTNAASVVEHGLASGAAFSAGSTKGLTSDFAGGTDTTATFRAGVTTDARTLSMQFATTATATNDMGRLSDVFSLQGNNGGEEVFVLQLSTGVIEPEGLNLARLDEGAWVLATTGIDGGSLAGEYNLSWTSFLAANGTFNKTTMLGAYGYDAATGTAWAVTNLGGNYALYSAVPEPSTWAIIGLGASVLLLRRKRRNASIG